jgi:hypothetical protein
MNLSSKTHLYSVTNKEPLKIADFDSYDTLIDRKEDMFPDSEEEFRYFASVFSEHNRYSYCLTVQSLSNPKKTSIEHFDFSKDEKETYMRTFNTNLQLAFGPHEKRILELRTNDIDELEKHLYNWMINKI